MRPGSTRHLTHEEETALARRWRDHGDVAAMHRIVTAHIPMARRMVSKVKGSNMSFDDLVQVAHIGLIVAAKKFDPEQGVRFCTYAHFWVRAEINAARTNEHMVMRGKSIKKIRETRHLGPLPIVSLSAPVASHEEGDATLGDAIPDSAPLPDEAAEQAIDGERAGAAMRRALAKLKPKEAKVILGRFMAEPRLKLDQLGQEIGVSKERARQIEKIALGKLRLAMAPQPEMA